MIIAGAKGFAKEILEVLHRDFQYKEISFYDDLSHQLTDKIANKYKVLRSETELKELLKQDASFVLGVGVPKIRYQLEQLFNKNGGIIKTIISKHAIVGSFDTNIREGTTVMDGVKITNNVQIGKCCLINMDALIAHDCIIGDYADIAPQVVISGNCKVGDFVSIGTSAVLLPGVKVGNNVIIGAGSVVKNDISDNSLVIGTPGKVVKKLPPII